jgi:hypothetical protein
MILLLPPAYKEPSPDELTQDSPERLKLALKIASENIGRLAHQRTQLTSALNTALILVEQLMSDLRHKGINPSGQSVVAKATLDQAMERLLRAGKARDEQ